MQRMILSFVACCLLATQGTTLYAFENNKVHRSINENASQQSMLDQYVRNVTGFENGLETYFAGQKIIEHIKEGGTTEDRLPRPFNHFHDPLEPWENAGLSWAPGIFSTSCLIWAQNYSSLDEDTNQEEWLQARRSFYEALTTGSPENYATTFKILGQLMHLISDMAVPAHVRDDAHPEVMLPDGYSTHFEKYTHNANDLLNFNGLPFKPDMQICSRFILHAQASVPVSSLWDIDHYQGNNPDATLEPIIGLAEYTNANFFSEGTIFDNYPHPDKSATNYMDIDWTHPEITDAEDGKVDNRIYIYKYLAGGETIQPPRLAALGYFSREWMEEGAYGFDPLVLDDVVYRDYAAQLVPRAVGYSAALLDYFFRGTLAVTNGLPQPGVPITRTDGKIQWVTPMRDISAEVRNVSALGVDSDGNPILEPVGSGSLIGVARYTMGDTENYAISAMVAVDTALAEGLNSGSPQAIVFHFPTGIPAGATDLSLQVVFQGTLGNEPDTAIAAGRCPIPAGTVAIAFPDEFVYGIIDGSISPHQFTKVKAKIRNTTTMIDADGLTVPVEVSGGLLHAVAVYKIIPGLLEDLSNFPPDSSSLASLMAGESFTASVSAPIPIDALSSQQPTSFTFDFTDEPIPAGVTDLYLTIYYEGAAQADQSAIICLGGKDLNEPQHITYWNDTDYFLLYGAAVKADDIWDDPDAELYGYIAPHRISDSLGFSATYPYVNPPTVVAIEQVDAARHTRLIILTENVAQYYVTDRLVCHTPTGDSWFEGTYRYAMPGYVNQMRLDYTWQGTSLRTVRGITQHQRVYYMNFYPYFAYINTLPAPAANALGSFPVTIDFP